MELIHITGENFEQEVLQSQIPVLVDIWAPWSDHAKCRSCYRRNRKRE